MVVVANCDGDAVGGVHEFAAEFRFQDVFQHIGHLLLASAAVARHRLLDFLGRVLHDGNIPRQRSGHRHALRPSQFEHGLGIFAVKRVFDGHFVGQVLVDDLNHALEYFLQFEFVGRIFAQLDDPVLQQLDLLARDLDYAVAHHLGAGIHAQNYFIAAWLYTNHLAR